MTFGRAYLIQLLAIIALSSSLVKVYSFSSLLRLRPRNRHRNDLQLALIWNPFREANVVASSRSVLCGFYFYRRTKHVSLLALSSESRPSSIDDDSTWSTTIPYVAISNDTTSLTEVNLDWKVWYENAVVQIYNMQQKVNVQIQELLNQIEALQKHMESMSAELQNKDLEVQHALNESVSWQSLYTSMRQQHLLEIEATQNQYDTYVQNQRHEQVRNQIQYQRMQQQLQGQDTNFHSEIQQLQMQHENEKLLLENDHKLHVQQLHANFTLREQTLLDQSLRNHSLQLQLHEERFDKTIAEPLRKQLQQAESEVQATKDALLESQQRIAELQISQQSRQFVLSNIVGICKNRIVLLSPRRWLPLKFRRHSSFHIEDDALQDSLETPSTKVAPPSEQS